MKSYRNVGLAEQLRMSSRSIERHVDLHVTPRKPSSYWLGAKVRWVRKMKEIGNHAAAQAHEWHLLDVVQVWP